MGLFRSKSDPVGDGAEIARASAVGGGLFANLTAILALVFSGYSFYETVWKAQAIRLFVAPTMAFADPYNGPFDVFELPVTLANLGAQTGVALSFQLDVTNPRTKATKRYYAAGLGAWRTASKGETTPFAPVSVAGRAAETRRILFYPRAGETIDRHIEVEAGVYQFRLTVATASTGRIAGQPLPEAEPIVVEFEMEIDGLDYRAFNDGGTLTFRRPDYAPVASD